MLSKKKTYIGLFLFVCFFYLFSIRLFAMDIKVHSLEPGKKITVKKNNVSFYYDDPEYHLYRIVTPDIGYITIKTEGKFGYLLIYDEIEDLKENLVLTCYPSSDSLNDRNTYQIAVEKGQYYIAFQNNLNQKIRMQYKFKKIKPKANYCKAKASTLKKGKKVTICSSLLHEYDRWYKIRLTSKSAIKLEATKPLYDFKMYNTKRKQIDLSSAGSGSVGFYGTTYEKLPKGTYYLKIPAMDHLEVIQICLQ